MISLLIMQSHFCRNQPFGRFKFFQVSNVFHEQIALPRHAEPKTVVSKLATHTRTQEWVSTVYKRVNVCFLFIHS